VDECVVAVRCWHHVAHSVGDLVDLAPDLAGGLEHYDIEPDVNALDRCTHACWPGPNHDHVVECFDVHEPTLRPGSVPISWPEEVALSRRGSCFLPLLSIPCAIRARSS